MNMYIFNAYDTLYNNKVIIYEWSNLLTHFKSKNLLLCKNDTANTFGTQIENLYVQ